MISVEYREAIVEVLDILEHSDHSIYNKIPKKLIDFWQKNKSETYKPKLDHNKPLVEMELKEKTKALLGMIYINYLCIDTEKKEIIRVLKDNEEKYQKELREKYNPKNIFKNRQEATNKKSKLQDIVVYKETTFIQKIFDKIKIFFKIKK